MTGKKAIFLAGVLFTSLGWILIFASSSRQTSANEGLWRDVPENQFRGEVSHRLIIPDQYRTLQADTIQLQAVLNQAPPENSDAGRDGAVILSLPLPDGEYGRFQIVTSPVMAPELTAKFPEIKTYVGQGIDDPTAAARLDWTPHGFHGMILSANGTIFIDPYSQGNITNYISYDKKAFTPANTLPELPPIDIPNSLTTARQPLDTNLSANTSGSQLRTYRLAVAATGEYTAFHGGTVSLGQAAIVTAINRVTGIYEREVAVRLTLVANNSLLVYTNGATDPYTNDDGFAMLSQNQTNINAVIGSANYDVGHVFSTGGGGIANVGVICNGSFKAGGVTGLPSPTGDPFYVDYVSHELGHQFSALHTFNSTTGSCFGNRTSSTAYEPGSATTIMGYAGICGADNIQFSGDDYFHTISFDQIRNHVTAGSGSSCGTVTATGNTPPVADAGTGGFTIPINTPFMLTGAGSDANEDALTYSWEQFDLGAGGSPDGPTGNAPIFRSFIATSSPTRTFPQMSDIVNNTHTLGEILPSYARSLNFRLTVRDNRTGGGGVDYDTLSFDVTDAAGPFLVTGPNTAVSWTGSSSATISWDVANTDQAPVSCAAVNLLLSTDGGWTYPITLLSGTANDGTQLITVPNLSTSTARVKVECTDNIFFDISDENFTISAGSAQAPTAVSVTGPVTGTVQIEYTFTADVTPPGATIPITYEWSVTDQTALSQVNMLSDTAGFIWTTSGTKTIVVTATNSAGMAVSAPFTINIEADETIFLPLLLKE